MEVRHALFPALTFGTNPTVNSAQHMLARLHRERYVAAMSTLPEIEAAIERLLPEEQRQLHSWLGSRQPPPHSRPRAEWLGKLARLRASVATGKNGTPSEAILSELRAERA